MKTSDSCKIQVTRHYPLAGKIDGYIPFLYEKCFGICKAVNDRCGLELFILLFDDIKDFILISRTQQSLFELIIF